jgi:hypothetical protein
MLRIAFQFSKTAQLTFGETINSIPVRNYADFRHFDLAALQGAHMK